MVIQTRTLTVPIYIIICRHIQPFPNIYTSTDNFQGPALLYTVTNRTYTGPNLSVDLRRTCQFFTKNLTLLEWSSPFLGLPVHSKGSFSVFFVLLGLFFYILCFISLSIPIYRVSFPVYIYICSLFLCLFLYIRSFFLFISIYVIFSLYILYILIDIIPYILYILYIFMSILVYIYV